MIAISSIAELAALAGSEVGVSDWVEITQSMIDQFADLTGDRQWIHVDPARAAAESPFGTTIAHGFLTLSMLSRLVLETVQVDGGARLTVNYGFNRVRFPAPVRSRSRVRARIGLAGVKPVPGGVEAAWTVTIEIENESKPAVAAEWLTRMLG